MPSETGQPLAENLSLNISNNESDLLLDQNHIEKSCLDVLVLGSGPGALAIAAALAKENLQIEILSAQTKDDTWPFTYGIWGEEVDDLGLGHLLEHRWQNTVSFFGEGSMNPKDKKNFATEHNRDYGLFDKKKLQMYWLNECEQRSIKWHLGTAESLETNHIYSTVTTSSGEKLTARLIVDATGYKPVFVKSPDQGPIAVQTCYGVVGKFNTPPVKKGQFVLMDYRCNHLNEEEKLEPPTFLYAMDMGNGNFFLEETSLGLSPPFTLEKLKYRLEKRLSHNGLKITSLEHEELGLFLPMNMPIPDLSQPILGFGGSAGMVHPASGYMVGSLLRRAPDVAKAIYIAMQNPEASPNQLAKIGWNILWPAELKRKQALYKFGLEKLMRFKENQLRDFFIEFFSLPNKQWYGFLTNTLTLKELILAMWAMFKKAPWNIKWGLMEMQGRELKLLFNFLKPNP